MLSLGARDTFRDVYQSYGRDENSRGDDSTNAFRVLCSGVVEVKFKSFENREGRRFDGSLCDSSWWWFFSDGTDLCDHRFIICMGNITESSDMTACEFGRQETGSTAGNKIYFNGNIGGTPNPMKFNFNHWPGIVKVKLDVVDDDDGNTYDFVDHYEYQYETTSLGKEDDAPVKDLLLTGTRSSIDLQLKVFCDAHYYGQECLKFCKPADDETGHYTCDSITGDKICLTGVVCEAEINECASNPCLNDGSCQDASAGFLCICLPGFTGRLCESDIKECISNPCLNEGTCEEGVNGYNCTCMQGWTGSRCEFNIDECASAPCLHATNCHDGLNDYTCDCSPGYTGKSCEFSTNECASSPCLNSGFCEDLNNAYRCHCLKGTSGTHCEVNEDECESEPCQNGGSCLDQLGTYLCYCAKGYTGEMCQNKLGGCDSGPCLSGGTCMDTVDGFLCKCPVGLTGEVCEVNINDCESLPCRNGGQCSDGINNFTCSCPDGFTGSLCEISVENVTTQKTSETATLASISTSSTTTPMVVSSESAVTASTRNHSSNQETKPPALSHKSLTAQSLFQQVQFQKGHHRVIKNQVSQRK
ncbi:fibropellin-1-like [Haliotis asinina]|uniref:fibropellin-1-like n=1 Tax=Haliotis asinina TaxID=109174 RepID=UPI0035327EA1